MPVFTAEQNEIFNSARGAFSEVTDREANGDKAVTVDRDEKAILSTIYELESFSRRVDGLDIGEPHKVFNVFNLETGSYEEYPLAIKYPKKDKNELRLYFNRESGFYPSEDSTWFIFTRNDSQYPFIGSIETDQWNSLNLQPKAEDVLDKIFDIDKDDEEYQQEIIQPEKANESKRTETTVYKRSASTAKKCIEAAHYTCQFNTDHKTFVSAVSNKQFVEAHHLIPVSKQADFEHSLDVQSNIVVLCPNCHRAIHFGTEPVKRKYLEFFYEDRKDNLKKAGLDISLDQLVNYYI